MKKKIQATEAIEVADTVKKSPAARARAKKGAVAKSTEIVDTVTKITKTKTDKAAKSDDFKPLDKYMPRQTTDTAGSSNWWLDTTTNENWAYAHDVFTQEECKRIIEIGTNGIGASPLTYGVVGDLNNAEKNIEEIAKIRRSPVAWLRSDVQENHWIYQRLTGAIKSINDQFFNYDLTEIQSLQFTSYDAEEEGFYGKHIDMMYTGTGTRKLSVSIQLSSGDDYEGGDLLLHTRDDPERPHRQQGTGIFFPGYTLHEVTPVTRGKRYSLVAWVLGPRFK
jgi:PKHD-type hydroxylase